MSDTTPETCTVAGDIEPLQDRSGPMWPQWLSTVAAFGGVAAALEWLKLTR